MNEIYAILHEAFKISVICQIRLLRMSQRFQFFFRQGWPPKLAKVPSSWIDGSATSASTQIVTWHPLQGIILNDFPQMPPTPPAVFKKIVHVHSEASNWISGMLKIFNHPSWFVVWDFVHIRQQNKIILSQMHILYISEQETPLPLLPFPRIYLRRIKNGKYLIFLLHGVNRFWFSSKYNLEGFPVSAMLDSTMIKSSTN